MSYGMNCEQCGTEVQLSRKENYTLSVSCECSERSIKVATTLPEGWR